MPKSSVRRKSPADIIAGARRPEERVTVCLRADLANEIARLDEELQELTDGRSADRRMGEPAVTEQESVLAEQIHALEVEADENSIELLIRALPRNEWRAAKAKHPANETDSALGWAVDRDDLAMSVLAESVVDPELEPDVLADMADELAEGQWAKIRDAILVANGGDGSVPFSQRASLIRQLSSNEAGSPGRTASVSNGSTDGPRARSRRSPSGDTDSPPNG